MSAASAPPSAAPPFAGDKAALSLSDIARLGDPDPTPAPAPEPLVERDHAFVLRVATEAGMLEGTCVARIMGTEARMRAGRIRARLAGVPWDLLDPETQQLIDAQAVVAVALQPADRPKWLDDVLDGPLGTAVLLSLYEEVRAHEARFFRRAAGAGDGAASKPLVQVVPVPGAATLPADFRWERRDPLPGAVGGAGGAARQPPR